MTRPDEHDVVLCTLAVPMDVRLFADIGKALDRVTRLKKHRLQPAELLTDGTSRVVARRVGAPEPESPATDGAADDQQ